MVNLLPKRAKHPDYEEPLLTVMARLTDKHRGMVLQLAAQLYTLERGGKGNAIQDNRGKRHVTLARA